MCVGDEKKIEFLRRYMGKYSCLLSNPFNSLIKAIMSSPTYVYTGTSSPTYSPSSPTGTPPAPFSPTYAPASPPLPPVPTGPPPSGPPPRRPRPGPLDFGPPASGVAPNLRVDVTNDPRPEGTQYTIMLPWCDRRIRESFVHGKFRELDWGRILKIDMIWKGEQREKPGHYKVFIHFGDLNPQHSMVFEHLDGSAMVSGKDVSNELKIHYNDSHYWKVRKSSWKPRSSIGVEFVTAK